MRTSLSPFVALAALSVSALATVAPASAQSPSAFADSLGRWLAEVAVFDAATVLAVEDAESLRDCAVDGLASLAVIHGYDGLAESTTTERLYFEVSILEDSDGYSGYLSLAIRDRQGLLLRAIKGVETEVQAHWQP